MTSWQLDSKIKYLARVPSSYHRPSLHTSCYSGDVYLYTTETTSSFSVWNWSVKESTTGSVSLYDEYIDGVCIHTGMSSSSSDQNGIHTRRVHTHGSVLISMFVSILGRKILVFLIGIVFHTILIYRYSSAYSYRHIHIDCRRMSYSFNRIRCYPLRICCCESILIRIHASSSAVCVCVAWLIAGTEWNAQFVRPCYLGCYRCYRSFEMVVV